MIHVIDVASYQEGLNVGNCKDGNGVAPGIVIVKGTGGTKYTIPVCAKHYQQAKSARDEANFFVKECKNYFNEVVPFLDMEESVNGNNAVGARLWSQADVDWAYTWLKRVEELTGVKPVIYMSKSVCCALDWSEVSKANFGLSVAQYDDMNWTNFQTDPWTDNQELGAWEYAMMYRYSSTGKLQGWNAGVDFDLFYGDADSWRKYAKGSALKPVTPNVPDPKPVQNGYYAEKGKYKALKELPVKTHADFSGDSKQVIKVGQILDIIAVVEIKSGTAHGEVSGSGFVTLHKSYVEKTK